MLSLRVTLAIWGCQIRNSFNMLMLKMLFFSHDDDFLRLAHQWTQQNRPHGGIIYVHQEKLSLGECIRRLEEIALLFEYKDFLNHIEFR